MSADRNKTDVTLAVTEALVGWMARRGMKPIETEVPVARRWIADAAALWDPTHTEINKARLPLPPPATPARKTWDHVPMPFPSGLTVVGEVKVSRSDFTGDKKWAREPVANLQVLSIVKGIIEPEQYPPGWWVLIHAPAGRLMKVAQRTPAHVVDDLVRFETARSIGERHFNRHNGQFFRDLQKRHREQHAEQRMRWRFADALRAVFDIASGERTIEEATRYLSRRDSRGLSAHDQRRLEQIAGKLPELKEVGR